MLKALLAFLFAIALGGQAIASVDCIGGTPPKSLPAVAAAAQNLDYYNIRTNSIFYRQYNSIPADQILFVGDSHFDSFNTNDVSAKSVNLGIAGDTWVGLLNRLDAFRATNPIHRAAACVLLIGLNDIAPLADGYDISIERWIDLFAAWATGKWVIVLIPYVNEAQSGQPGLNAKIRVINEYMTAKFIQRSGFAVVSLNPMLAPDGQLLTSKTIDGEHLNREGYLDAVPLIRAGLRALSVDY